MRILLTGIAGFVGQTLLQTWRRAGAPVEVIGLDNFSRAGSEAARAELRRQGVALHHGDLRLASDVDSLPAVDWIVDAAAQPSVLAGLDGRVGSRQVVEHNLLGTVNLLEYARRCGAGLILLSTSRVYSINPLAELPLRERDDAFTLATGMPLPAGVSAAGIAEDFSTTPPLSLYGATKAASETLALEYHSAFGVPVWINRCGVLAGAGQLGMAEQGIFSYWLHAWRARWPLRYIGFGGRGLQVRDALHPRDLAQVLLTQMQDTDPAKPRVCNFAGGLSQSMSLAQLSRWCANRWGLREVQAAPDSRRFDLPWVVLDSARAQRVWHWRPTTPLPALLEEIAEFAEQHPHWLEQCAPDRR